MDGRRFDEFVTAVSKTTSRRQLLRTLFAGTLASLVGRGRTVGADEIPLRAQSSEPPVPNFPFLVALPTDPGLEHYELDVDLTVPPSRFTDIAVLPSLPQDWQAMVSQCRGAYVATIAQPKADKPSEPQRSITTILFDLGTPDTATATHTAYIARLLEKTTLRQLQSTRIPSGARDRITLIGCEGGCVDFSSPADSDVAPSGEVAAVGVADRFIFDARIREFGTASISSGQAATLGVGIDAKLGAVGTVGSTGTIAQASNGAMKRAKCAVTSLGAARLRLQRSADDIGQRLASAITLPIFGLGDVDPPKTATQWLQVDQGAVVPNFGESALAVAARQHIVKDVLFAMSLEQPLLQDQPYRGGYDLTLSATQYVFEREDEARDFFEESRDRIERGRPNMTFAEAGAEEDEWSYTYEDRGAANGSAFGLLTYTFITVGSFWAVIAVDLAAVPESSGQSPLDASDLRQDLGPLVAQVASALTDCLVTPGGCPSNSKLTVPEAPEPTPTAALCPANTQRCGDLCVDLSSDPANCGACGTVCLQDAVCSAGGCYCVTGTIYCNGICANLSTDPNNCGRCGNACTPDTFCEDGQCLCPDYNPPCGQMCCEPGWTCSDGTCVQPCPEGLLLCGDTCVDPSSDPANCGDCGIDCGSLACLGGTCGDPCSGQGLLLCGGTCVDPSSDPANCGDCGINCGGFSCCGGACVDTSSDPGNCGACYNACGSGDYCEGGTCYPYIG